MNILTLLKGDERDQLIQQVVSEVRIDSDKVTYLHVVSVNGEIPLKETGEVLDLCTEFNLDPYHKEAKQWKDSFLDRNNLNGDECLSLVGSPGEIAISKIREFDYDLVVSGAHVTSAIEELVVSSFTSQIIGEGNVPYLTVSSEGQLNSLDKISVICNQELRNDSQLSVIADLHYRLNCPVHFRHVGTGDEEVNWTKFYSQLSKDYGINSYLFSKTESTEPDTVLAELLQDDPGLIAFSESHSSELKELFIKDNRVSLVNHFDYPILIF